ISLLIDRIEDNAAEGVNKIGKKREYYIANHVSSNTLYICSDYKCESFFWIGSINPIRTSNKNIYAFNKEWIEILKKHSILISKANEFARFEYINSQRNYLSSQMGF
ncbi:hypothetical protein, partial [Chryseobacterium sp.]|uniref:hypothetical protein n=1 Tax=Chryseobacterium sp. TaxID=1871047 RepID=UPI0025BF57CA